jgi:hypothetical protein
MFQESSKDGFSFKVYQGAQMSLLTLDLAQQPAAGAFAGFTLEYTGPNSPRTPIKNLLNFTGTDTITSSIDSPFQAFKWVALSRQLLTESSAVRQLGLQRHTAFFR